MPGRGSKGGKPGQGRGMGHEGRQGGPERGGEPTDSSTGSEPGGGWFERGGEAPGRSGSSPGHLKKEAGERSAASFAPGRTGTAVDRGMGNDGDDDRDDVGGRD